MLSGVFFGDREKNRGVNMDENEKKRTGAASEPTDAEQVTNQEDNAQKPSTAYDPEKVTYEDNDDWQFEAEAPSVSHSIVFDSKNSKIEISSAETQKQESYQPNYSNEKQITVNTDIFKFVMVGILTLALFVAIAVLGYNYYTKPNMQEKMNPGNVALTVGDEDISVGMYNCYYNTLYNNYLSYGSQGYIDFSKDTQDADGNTITWQERIQQETVQQIEYVVSYYNEAVEHGYTLSDDDKNDIDAAITSLKETASSEGRSADDYAQEMYGDYCGIVTYEKYLTQMYIARAYYNDYLVETKISDDTLQAWLDEHESDYEKVPFAYLQISYDSSSDESKQEAIDKVENALSTVTDFESFRALIPTLCDDLIEQYVSYYSVSEDEAVAEIEQNIENQMSRDDTVWESEIIDWLFDEDTQVNSTKYVVSESDSLIYAVIKLGQPQLDEEELYSVRHILIRPESDDSSDSTTTQQSYTDAQWAAAKKEADKILAEYESGDKTELSFAKLANEYSADTSASYGGLYSAVSAGSMVTEFEDWAMDDSRQYGDTGIVKSQYGYHIMYFVQKAPSYVFDAQNDILAQQEQDFIHELPLSYGMAFSKVTNLNPATDSSQAS